MLSGLVLLLSVLFTLRAFKTGDVSVVIPIASLSFVFVAVISWTVLKEKINMARVIGVFCAVLAIILINL